MPLVALGCDVGARYVGWAVLDDTLLAHGVWDLQEAAVDWQPEAWLPAQAHRQIRRSRVTLLALEVFHWRRMQPVILEAARIQQHVGALFTLGRPRLTVVGYPAAAQAFAWPVGPRCWAGARCAAVCVRGLRRRGRLWCGRADRDGARSHRR
jgi:hypothetical protein